MPPLYNAYEAKILDVSHSKLCKENERKMISLSWATCPHTHTGLFSRVTCPHILKLVYFQGRPTHTLTLVCFHGRPAHTYSKWSIFRGDRPTHSHSLFYWVTCPPTHTSLFSRATYPHMFIMLARFEFATFFSFFF